MYCRELRYTQINMAKNDASDETKKSRIERLMNKLLCAVIIRPLVIRPQQR